MHEFSIAVNIIEIIENYTREISDARISQVNIEVGQFSGVVIDALDMALKHAVRDTRFDQAHFKIDNIRGMLKCLSCNNRYEAENIYDACPVCGSFNSEIIEGKELKVKSIEVD